jgi:hypothetical protein
VHDRIAARNGATQRVHLQQITENGFSGQPSEIFKLAGGADKDA